ncbi:zinc dependent phospholipase C family protein [Oceanobacillus saliphilus]|uniref:zinc dependent phospholipase C family protein n=1 Tax=Oceanobacillus saliphilus TaxID=2925834 RepID=UPI00201D4654|nr:zinc dependent phospholipase C family protein [Oceanobacillus saliphilus]
MPNIWTHILFCEDVIDTVKQPYPFSQYEPYMKLGAQGPDPFFYYNFWPWIKDEPVHEVGMALHTRRCGEFLMDLIISAKDQCSEVKAFVTGFITHHILDRNTHPYIHYRAGYEGSNHQKLEIFIDTLMMEKFHKLKTWKSPVYKEINVGRSLNSEVHLLLNQKINKFYPELKQKNPEYIQKAYKDMMLALKILSDPHGWKNVLLRSMISSYSHRPIKDDADYLNLSQTTWYHPATNEPSNKSFIELYSNARGESIDIIIELKNYWESSNAYSTERLSDLIANISYDTGKPLHLDLKNKYCDPIV